MKFALRRSDNVIKTIRYSLSDVKFVVIAKKWRFFNDRICDDVRLSKSYIFFIFAVWFAIFNFYSRAEI